MILSPQLKLIILYDLLILENDIIEPDNASVTSSGVRSVNMHSQESISNEQDPEIETNFIRISFYDVQKEACYKIINIIYETKFNIIEFNMVEDRVIGDIKEYSLERENEYINVQWAS